MKNVEEARNHLAELRRVVIDRYQLTEPLDSPLVAAIDTAIQAGADADVAGLRALVEGANLYQRHASLAEAALYGVELAFAVEPAVEVPKVKPIARQNRDELLATAASQGVKVPEDATNADLRAALAAVGFSAPEPEIEGPAEPETTAEHETPVSFESFPASFTEDAGELSFDSRP